MKAATVSSSPPYLDVASTRDNIERSEASTRNDQVSTLYRKCGHIGMVSLLVDLAVHLLHTWDA